LGPTSEDAVVSWERLRFSYDLVAAKYEERFRDELQGKARDRELLESFAGSVGDPIVEIGCGPGQVGVFVRERGRRVVGLDLSHEMAKLASCRLDGAVTADMRSLPLRTAAVGGILAFYSLIHLQRPELESVLRAFHRVLRPNGRILLSAHEGQGEVRVLEFLGEPAPVAATLFELAELTKCASAAGFDIIRAERREPYPSESQTVRLYVEGQRRGRVI
jgi:ubiquinone/menaquinone biosynthesis C-methylase UbiE